MIVYNEQFILSNIEEVVEQATFSILKQAKEWYPTAHTILKGYSKRYNVDFEVVVGICSCLSPMKYWMNNLQLTENFLKGGRYGHFTKQIQKAEKILKLDGIENKETQIESIMFELNGLKTINFFRNILEPLNNDYLTIDRHVLKVCYGNKIESLTNKQYEFLKQILIEQAKKHNFANTEYQSLLWLQIKT